MAVRTVGAEPDCDIPDNTCCFYCMVPIKTIAVFWAGEFEMWLHPACVVELTIRLYRDVHEVESGTGVYLARPQA